MTEETKATETEEKRPRVWLSKAYLMEIEPRTYALYRNMMTEQYNPRTMKDEEHLIKRVGPISKPLRLAEKGEEQRVVLKTVDPKSGNEMWLVELDG